MGLETSKNKNKMEGGLTTSNGLSDSNTFVKLTVKVKDKHCSKKHQLNTWKKYQPGLKQKKTQTQSAHCLGLSRASVNACVCLRKRRKQAPDWIFGCQKLWTHIWWERRCLSREGGTLCSVPMARRCFPVMLFGVHWFMIMLLRITLSYCNQNINNAVCCLTHVLIYSSYMSAHLGGEGRKEKAAAAARTTEDLFGSTSESDTSTFHGFDEDDLEEPRTCRGRRGGGRGSPSADKKGTC